MLPLVTYGIAEASTTRRPSSPCTRMLVGSTTERGSVPIFAVQEGCSAVSASLATQLRICSGVSISGPGEISPELNSANAGCSRIRRVTCTASTHSRRSCSVER